MYRLLGKTEYNQIKDYGLEDLKDIYQEKLLYKYLLRHFTPEQLEPFYDYSIAEMRVMLAEIDIEYFAQAYFVHYIYSPIPEHHSESYRELYGIARALRGRRVARAEPRGNAKTTRYDLIFPMWCALYEVKRYIIIISASDTLAKGFLRSMKDEFEENELILQDFGNLRGKKWTENEIQLSNGCRIESKGWEGSIRGKKNKADRPDLIIVDDIEKDDSKTSETIRKKMEDFFFTALTPAGSAVTDIIVIGTILHSDSLLKKVLDNPRYDSKIFKAIISWADRQDLWDKWKSIYTDIGVEGGVEEAHRRAREFYEQNKEEMLKGTEVLWKGKDGYGDYYALMEELMELGETRFAQEKQNEPIDPSKNIFYGKLEFYTHLPPSEEFTQIVGAVDPSLGKKKTSDFSAIVWLGKHKSGYIYVLEADIQRRHPNKIIQDLFASYNRMVNTYGQKKIKWIAIEAVAFQEFFKDKVKEEGAKQGIYPPIKPLYPHSDKALRIASLEPDVVNGYIKFNQNHKELIKQFENFTLDLNYHDDGPDTVHMCMELLKKRRPKQKRLNLNKSKADLGL
ncbi:hypothetical protein BBF96_03455 [Anoxybacter fermentans]|uniref:Terminase large subunit gp17-like C-terminal domain-containing protein n=1 Tax=Anoxybacter fermentans TaxID=1323375 RepID=A0A3S9T2R7_9FIRM|nr:hypothetical protein BBF96_03455 [Anoxybacter fermentans]